jgi:hypothetical protein
MFWKIALFLGAFGIILGIIILIISIAVLSSSTDEKTKDIAVGGFLFSIALIIFSFFAALIAVIFVLRASKRDFDAKHQ